MKPSIFFSLFVLFFSFACTTPISQDFEQGEQPLSSDEYLVIWRFTRYATPSEVLDQSKEHKQALEKNMDPLFSQLIPQIMADALKGEVALNANRDWESPDFHAIDNLNQYMAESYGASSSNLEALTQVFHIIQRREANTKGWNADELLLQLVAKDPTGNVRERFFARISFEEILGQEYRIKVGTKEILVNEYLEEIIEYAYPIAFQMEGKIVGLTSLKEAFGSKAYALEGRWDELEWFDNGPNISNYLYTAEDSARAMSFQGEYSVQPDSGSVLTIGDKLIKVKVVSKADRLEFAWSNQNMYHWYLLYPRKDGTYFNNLGDVCTFREAEGKITGFQIKTHDGYLIEGTAL
ncbi:MAG: hypothetical protein AAFN10_24145 [Bacteroidota bacterium]